MHRDTKVGLALGVLLVGVVAAFFFRNEGRAQNDVPSLADRPLEATPERHVEKADDEFDRTQPFVCLHDDEFHVDRGFPLLLDESEEDLAGGYGKGGPPTAGPVPQGRERNPGGPGSPNRS